MFKKSILTTVVTGILLSSASYNINAAEEEIERIEVTGSHIRRTDMEGPFTCY